MILIGQKTFQIPLRTSHLLSCPFCASYFSSSQPGLQPWPSSLLQFLGASNSSIRKVTHACIIQPPTYTNTIWLGWGFYLARTRYKFISQSDFVTWMNSFNNSSFISLATRGIIIYVYINFIYIYKYFLTVVTQTKSNACMHVWKQIKFRPTVWGRLPQTPTATWWAWYCYCQVPPMALQCLGRASSCFSTHTYSSCLPALPVCAIASGNIYYGPSSPQRLNLSLCGSNLSFTTPCMNACHVIWEHGVIYHYLMIIFNRNTIIANSALSNVNTYQMWTCMILFRCMRGQMAEGKDVEDPELFYCMH